MSDNVRRCLTAIGWTVVFGGASAAVVFLLVGIVRAIALG